MRKYSNIGTDRGEALFLVRFFFLVSGRTDNTKKKERSNKRERERTREKKREKELERTRESFNQKHMNHKSTTFCSREKKHRKLCLSTHQMASPEAAAILRELQGKNGNGVRV